MHAEPPNDSHRRDFVRTALVLGASTLALPQDARGDEPKKDEKPKSPPDPIKAEAEARYQVVLARFGKHEKLDAAAKERIRGEIEGIVRRADSLRKFPLENGDGPFPVFRPYRAPLA